MDNRNEKTVTLNYQGRVDGTVEAFDVNGMMAIPGEDGVTYVRWKDVVDFFPQASEANQLPEGADMAVDILTSFLNMTSAKFDPEKAEKLQRVITHLQGNVPEVAHG